MGNDPDPPPWASPAPTDGAEALKDPQEQACSPPPSPTSDGMGSIELAQPDPEPVDDGGIVDTPPEIKPPQPSTGEGEERLTDANEDMEVDKPEPEAIFWTLGSSASTDPEHREPRWKEQVQTIFEHVYGTVRFDPTKTTEAMKRYPEINDNEAEVLFEAVQILTQLPANGLRFRKMEGSSHRLL